MPRVIHAQDGVLEVGSVIQGTLVFERLSNFCPLSAAAVEDYNRRVQIALRLARIFPYSFEDIYPLTDITQDEALIRSVLADYVGVPDALALVRSTLLDMHPMEVEEGAVCQE